MRLLLARDDVNPDKPDNDCSTPLPGASRNEHEEVVRPPVSWDSITPDQPDNDDTTLLQCSPSKVHEGVVRSPVTQGNDTPEPPPKTSRMRRYRQIIAQHIFPCWVEKRETRPKNGQSISFGHVLEILRWHCIFIHNFHLLAVYIILLELVMDRV